MPIQLTNPRVHLISKLNHQPWAILIIQAQPSFKTNPEHLAFVRRLFGIKR